MRHRLFGAVPESIIATTSFRRLAPEALAFLRATADATCVVADVLDAHSVGSIVPATEIGPLRRGQRVCGQAVTLRCEAYGGIPQAHRSRNAPLLAGDRDLYGVAAPGDVALIGADGDRTAATIGDISQSFAFHAGIAGVLVDGAVRDVETLRNGRVPVWCRGATPLAARHRWAAAEINGPLTFAGARIEPGDVVVADDNGLCVIPLADADDVLADCRKLALAEDELAGRLRTATSLEHLIRLVRGNALT